MNSKKMIVTLALAGFSLFGINATAQHAKHHATSKGCPQTSAMMQQGMMGKGVMSKREAIEGEMSQQSTQNLITQMKQNLSSIQSETLPPEAKAQLSAQGALLDQLQSQVQHCCPMMQQMAEPRSSCAGTDNSAAGNHPARRFDPR